MSSPSLARVTSALTALGAAGSPTMLPDSARTAAEAAAALGCDVGAIANSLVFAAGDSPVLVLTSGAHRVDTALVARHLGVERLERASPDFVREHTGQAIGGVAPIGHPTPLPTYVDRWLERHDVVWAAAGHPHAVFPTSYDELLRLTGGEPVDVES
jgi:prolyl-tRNA editing enzyme YbaK/EbsC (Cys-tRNA(Pro) deacylase)